VHAGEVLPPDHPPGGEGTARAVRARREAEVDAPVGEVGPRGVEGFVNARQPGPSWAANSEEPRCAELKRSRPASPPAGQPRDSKLEAFDRCAGGASSPFAPGR